MIRNESRGGVGEQIRGRVGVVGQVGGGVRGEVGRRATKSILDGTKTWILFVLFSM